MKKLTILFLAFCCTLSLAACGKEKQPVEPYIPPVQGGYYQETEPSIESTTVSTVPVQTAPIETEPTVDETEPVVEEPAVPTEPQRTYIEEMKLLHEGNEIYFKYNQLNDIQKETYLMACDAIEQGHPTFFLGEVKITTDEAHEALRAVWFDHPEFFWYTNEYTISFIDNQVFSVDLSYYPELMNKFEANKKAFNKVIDALVARAQEKNSILDQEKMIHDYICKSTVYQEGPLDQTAWSCLVERKTVCAGYARAFQIVMNKLGAPCYMIVGDMITDGEAVRHAWNVVKLVDGYYAMDVTSNDCDEKSCVLYNKYNFAYATFADEYVIDEDCLDFPDCTETRYSFSNTYGIDENVASAMSFTDSDTVIYSLEEYKLFHEQICRNNGFGEWEVKYVLVGEELLNQVMAYIQEQKYMDTYIMDIAKFNNAPAVTLSESIMRVDFDNAYGIMHSVKISEG